MTRLSERGQLGIDIRKLESYCLSPAHPRGRHKARVFLNALGIGRADAGWLRDELLKGASNAEAEEIGSDAFGPRWRADIAISRQGRRAVVRTLWIERSGQLDVRLVTCWVL